MWMCPLFIFWSLKPFIAMSFFLHSCWTVDLILHICKSICHSCCFRVSPLHCYVLFFDRLICRIFMQKSMYFRIIPYFLFMSYGNHFWPKRPQVWLLLFFCFFCCYFFYDHLAFLNHCLNFILCLNSKCHKSHLSSFIPFRWS